MSDQPLLKIENLRKTYAPAGWLSPAPAVEALAAVDLEVAPGKTLAIVGESGSGKSTLARCIAGMEQPDGGRIWFDGGDLTALTGKQRRAYSLQIQLVLQHSAGALNPRFTANDVVEEPLLLQHRGNAADRESVIASAISAVGLPAGCGTRRVLQFSGGQRQRLSLARSLVLHPRLLILDEALTGLDLPIQAQILGLLRELQRDDGLTYLFISHDLEAVASIAGEVAIMQHGRIVERGQTAQVLRAPRHEYTKTLLSAHGMLSGAVSA